MATTWYLHVYQGQGAVVELPVTRICHDKTLRSIKAVGSARCRTCVGIYVKLNDTHCFVAHISAWIAEDYKGNPLTGDPDERWLPDNLQRVSLYQTVLERLNDDQDLVQLRHDPEYDQYRGEAVICCPKMIMKGTNATGYHVVQALKEFFGLDDIEVRPTHGFGKDHFNNKATYWQYQHGNEYNLPCHNANLTNLVAMPVDPEMIGLAAMEGVETTQTSKGSDGSDGSNSDANETRDSSHASLHHDESNCTELWPDWYGWEATKRLDKNLDCNQTGAGGDWNLVWRHDSSWEPSESQLADRRNCLLADMIVTS